MAQWSRFLQARTIMNKAQGKVPMVTGPRSKRKFELIPVRDPEIYPLLICVSAAVAMLGIYNVHNLMQNPDINLDKKRRETQTIERYDPSEGREYSKHRVQLATLHSTPANDDKPYH